MSGHPGDLTPEQDKALQELKARVAVWVEEKVNQDGWTLTEEQKAMLSVDLFYLKFLRGRKWDLEATYKNYVETMQWRHDFQGVGVDNITEDMIASELKSGKSFWYKFDKKRQAIVYIRPRCHNPSGTDAAEMERFVVWNTELGAKLLQPGVETGLVVYDMSGFGMKNLDYSQVKGQIHILENYYPESMGTTLIVNSPWFFSACFKLIKGWLDPVVASKIRFISMSEMKDYIDVENLPVEYGGKDPFVYSYIPPEERVGEFADWKPCWQLPWAYEWKQKKEEDPSS